MAAQHGPAAATKISLPGTFIRVLDVRALSPYIVNTGNNGQLSATGYFNTRAEDLDVIVDSLIPGHRAEWGVADSAKVDVALYAHGGLNNEQDAAQTASIWIPLLKRSKVFPIFFAWESGFLDTLLSELEDYYNKRDKLPEGRVIDWVDLHLSDRVESLARHIGRQRWAEMKENAKCLSTTGNGGARLLVDRLKKLNGSIRLHLVGHSAGSIIHTHLARLLIDEGFSIESISLMAPAVREDTFNEIVVPYLQSRQIARMAQFHLSDVVEDNEGGMRIALLYKRSLLYMVSNALEWERKVPVLGMQKFFDLNSKVNALPSVRAYVAPHSAQTNAARHCGFDDDPSTQRSVVQHILGEPVTG